MENNSSFNDRACFEKIKISCIACGNNGLPPLTINQSNYEYIILEISKLPIRIYE